MFFHVFTFAASRGNCVDTKPLGIEFKLFPRDPANVQAMEHV